VGRFLEHSRIFYFENAGTPEVYLGSADWMPRNLYERVEVLFPVKDELLQKRLCEEILPAYLADTRKARILGADGVYTQVRRTKGVKRFSVQGHLMELAEASASRSGRPRSQVTAAYNGSDPKGAVVAPTETLELEVQDSTNATV